MPERITADILVVGAGIAGLWIAREAVSRGYRCVLIDETPIGQFASTRNQGWLQSGALDALYGIRRLAHDCQDGSRILWQFGSSPEPSLLRETSGYLFFEGQDQARRVLRWCEEQGISAKAVTWDAQSTLAVDERLAFAVQVSEAVMDTAAILQRLITELSSQLTWVTTDDMRALIPTADGGRWQARTSAITIEASGLILACNSLIPTLLSGMGIQPPRSLTVEEIAVVVLHQQLTTDVMATPIVATGPHLVPTFDQETPRSTVILTRLSPEIDPVEVSTVRARPPLPDATMQTIVEELLLWYPGLVDRIRAHQPVPLHGYLCQRLSNNRRTDPIIHGNTRLNAESYPPLVITYPGRFTAAPIRAVEVLDTLLAAGTIPCSGVEPVASRLPIPQVDTQPYREPPTHWLSLSDSGWPRISKYND